jgi:CMP-N-acetylneuraminic acid synthetase
MAKRFGILLSMRTAPSILGLILARGGSKRVPRKNVLPMGGKPLIAYTIDAARESGVIDRIVVSTDDQEIADVSRKHGAEAPFMRPPELATDAATSEDAMVHAVEWLQRENGYVPDFILLLQPTTPFRTADDIRGAVALQAEKRADGIVGMRAFTPHPFLITEHGDGRVDVKEGVSQPTSLHLNGLLYLVRTEVFLKERTLYPSGRTYPYVIPEDRSLDIDSPADWKLAEAMMAVARHDLQANR